MNFSSLFTGAPAAASPAAAPPRYRLLLVDDEPGVVKALGRVFRQENYEVLTAGSAEEALALLAGEGAVQVVISDYMMPGMKGADFLKRVKELYPDTIRIMLTGHADTGAVMGAINEGAVYKFILKPWNDDDLRVTVALAIEQFDLVQKNRVLRTENEKKSKEISALARLATTNRSHLGIMLHKKGLLSPAQLQELVRLQETRKEPLIKLLLEKDWVPERKIRDILRYDMLIEVVDLAEFAIDPVLAEIIPASFCRRQIVVPLKLEGRRLMLAMADPLDTGLVEDVRFTAGLDLKIVTADTSAIQAKIDDLYGSETDIKELATFVSAPDPYEGIEIIIEDDEETPLEELLRGTEEPPAIRLANAILLEAIRLGASDIHIQPRSKSVAVRLRIDGVLQDKIQVPLAMHPSLVSRLKIMAELDISERRRPQDGRITVKTSLRIVDLRVSTLPTINGEKVVMRILDRNSAVLDIASLGLAEGDLRKVELMVEKPQGIILATGPTGSGKTTTLYSLLQHNATAQKNYITIEDPVEYYVDIAGQVLVREKIGLNFPLVLRAILRQDPDVILLGEIRDLETAEVAFHAALTGHQVFSTLHTNSAVATVARLMDLGLKPFVVATALEGIIAQRLVRKLCPACREEAPADPKTARQLGAAFAGPAFRGRGCPQCHGTGYRGRLGIYEVLMLDDVLRERIAADASVLELRRVAEERGLRTIAADAAEKVRAGLTTAEEVLRVLGPQAE